MTTAAVGGIADLPAWLAGVWTVRRTIDGDRGLFTGTARFEPVDGDGDGLAWSERGRLTLDAYAGPARRTLRLETLGAGRVQVRFDDGRPFHDLDLRSGRWRARHRCGPDTYVGSFVVAGADAMTVCWRVTGPGRDDEIVSCYERLTEPSRR